VDYLTSKFLEGVPTDIKEGLVQLNLEQARDLAAFPDVCGEPLPVVLPEANELNRQTGGLSLLLFFLFCRE
jgi:hypothetical protein